MIKDNLFKSLVIISLVVGAASLAVGVVNLTKDEEEKAGSYLDAIYSVAELKSSIDEENVEYGSAVKVSENNVFLTNAHVIAYTKNGNVNEFDSYKVRFAFEDSYHEAKVLKYDYANDLALIKVEERIENSKPIKIGKENKLKYGDEIYAIGNGLNHGIGITKGYVSIPEIVIQTNEVYKKVIQCDLTVNPGNSGGALVNKNGDLVGITSFRIRTYDGNVAYGTSFAIPVEQFLEFSQDTF